MSTQSPAENEAVKPRRRRLAAVSVAAAVVLAGTGTYAVQSALDGGQGRPAATGDARSTPEPLVLDGHGPAREAGGSTASGGPYRLAGEAPKAPKSAPVYRTAAVDRAAVAELAASLGLKAEPRRQGESWLVGEGRDGTGPTLRVSGTAAGERGQWVYTRSGPAGDPKCGRLPEPGTQPDRPPRCPTLHDGVPGAGEGALTGGPDAPVTSPGSGAGAPAEQAEGIDPVSPEEAGEAAAPVLEALGLEDAEVDADRTMGALRMVTARPELDGLPVQGWDTTVTIGSDGEPVRGHGALAPLVEDENYPVLGAEETLAELNRTRSAREDVHCVRAPCEQPSGGGTVEVRRAVFGLAAHSSQGERVLVPSWRFEWDGGGAVSHPAVAPEHLADSEGGSGEGRGGVEPGSPGDVEPAPRPGNAVESYRAEDRKLTVRFWGGVCSDHSAKAEETGDEIRIRIIEKEHEPGGVCIEIAKLLTAEAALDEPVGERRVVDEHGERVPRR